MSKTAFIGHREAYAVDLRERVKTAVTEEVSRGCDLFMMGTHGAFDSLAFGVCTRLKTEMRGFDIAVVITSLHAVEHGDFTGFRTVMYDIEEEHYKRRITLSNRHMIDECDALICYVDTARRSSGARTAMRYAERTGKRIINLYRAEDDPYAGLSIEAAADELDKQYERAFKNNR